MKAPDALTNMILDRLLESSQFQDALRERIAAGPSGLDDFESFLQFSIDDLLFELTENPEREVV